MKNKKLTALYKIGNENRIRNMVQDDYLTKQDFTKDLRANGFKVVGIFTEAQIQHIRVTSSYKLPLYLSDRVIYYIKNLI